MEMNMNEKSASRCLAYIGIPIIGNNKELLQGSVTLKDGTEVNFHNGMIDGNLYDENEKIIEKRPAIMYENGGYEYWENGRPQGFPAIIQNFGYYEEDWDNGKCIAIREDKAME